MKNHALSETLEKGRDEPLSDAIVFTSTSNNRRRDGCDQSGDGIVREE